MDSHLEKLKAGGLKITSQREAVLELFHKDNSIKTPQAVHKKLKKKLPHIGLPTVYRALEELKEIGILIQLPSEDRQFHYSLCGPLGEKQHHHHFVCRKCKKVQEIACCSLKPLIDFARHKLGAIIESHSLQLEGLCAACK